MQKLKPQQEPPAMFGTFVCVNTIPLNEEWWLFTFQGPADSSPACQLVARNGIIPPWLVGESYTFNFETHLP